MNNGAASVRFCITTPPSNGPTAHPAFRVTFVMPLAYVRAEGGTTAMTYDWRVGTSISTSASRNRKRVAATVTVGAAGASIRKRLDGRCVHTIVFNSPIRRANEAAA